MTFQELNEKGINEENVLAFFRHTGINNVKVLIKNDKGSYDEYKMINNKDSLYNPLIDYTDLLWKDHWYSPYKIEFMGITKERFYVSDFIDLIERGNIKLVEA